jgi:hypothetical protein
MLYRILASGPIIQGNGTLPHRIVLVAWYDGGDTITKLSVHTQVFNSPEFPKRERFTSLDNGSYFLGEDAEIEAPLAFAKRLAAHISTYGRHINTAFVPEERSDAYSK